jgi:hypothetical protein
MSVNVAQVHTEVTAAGGGRPGDGRDPKGAGESAEEKAREAGRRREWLERRVAAEGFDD